LPAEDAPGDITVVPAHRALATRPKVNMALFERLAKDPDVDPAKLRDLLDLQKDIMAMHARAEFEAAFAEMHPLLPAIEKKGRITNKDKSLRSKFGRLEDIQAVTKPIYSRYGFTLRHRTEFPADKPGIIRIRGILTHVAGHFETSEFEAKADLSEYRTEIQSQGSTVSYGRRYTTIDLLNLEFKNMDDDGQAGHVERDATDRPSAHHNQVEARISGPQYKRLRAIMLRMQRSEAEVLVWVNARYGFADLEAVTRRHYDAICTTLEKPGRLPAPEEDGRG
jgi:hypothetical protein